jgi:sugar phosphate isomerase/epimerase
MKIMGRTQPLAKYPILECLTLIKRLGFDSVEVCLENPDLAPEHLTHEQATQVREKVIELGLTPWSVSYHKDYIYDDVQLELTKKAIKMTPVVGSKVFVFAGTSKRSGDHTEWQRMLDRTRELVQMAEEHDVVIAEEFEPGFIVGNTQELLRLFDAIPSRHLAANLDLGHAFLCDPDPLESIRQLGTKIIHCHIENMKAGVHEHLLPWEGDMALDTYLAVLREIGYQGGLALDLYKHDYEAVATESVTYLRKAMRHVIA